MNTDIRDYTICGLVDPETRRIMFVFMTVDPFQNKVNSYAAIATGLMV